MVVVDVGVGRGERVGGTRRIRNYEIVIVSHIETKILKRYFSD